VIIIRADVRNIPITDGFIDVVITSPPYLNAIDYLRGHKLSLAWLGYKISDIIPIRSNNIGAERVPEMSADLELAYQSTTTRIAGGLRVPPRGGRLFEKPPEGGMAKKAPKGANNYFAQPLKGLSRPRMAPLGPQQAALDPPHSLVVFLDVIAEVQLLILSLISLFRITDVLADHFFV